MTDKLSPEQSWWGWKLLIVASILSLLFMIVFTWRSTMNLTTCQVKKKQMTESHEQMNHAEMHSSSAQ